MRGTVATSPGEGRSVASGSSAETIALEEQFSVSDRKGRIR